MTLFEQRLKEAYSKGLITYFSKEMYDDSDNLANFDENFIKKFENKYFLGCDIKNIISFNNANEACHAVAVAVALCLDSYTIKTSDLELYKNFLETSFNAILYKGYEHSYTVVNIDGKKVVIDPVFGMITDEETYNYVFGVNKKYEYTKEELEEAEPIKILKENLEEAIVDKELIEKYWMSCAKYQNESFGLQYFMNRCLLAASSPEFISKWQQSDILREEKNSSSLIV